MTEDIGFGWGSWSWSIQLRVRVADRPEGEGKLRQSVAQGWGSSLAWSEEAGTHPIQLTAWQAQRDQRWLRCRGRGRENFSRTGRRAGNRGRIPDSRTHTCLGPPVLSAFSLSRAWSPEAWAAVREGPHWI